MNILIVTILNPCRFNYCHASGQGGAVTATSGLVTVNLSQSSFLGCRSESAGGALAVLDSAHLIVWTTTFSRNEAGGQGGGALYAGNAMLIISNDVTCNHNVANFGGGGALYWDGSAPPRINDDQTSQDGAGCLCGDGNSAEYGPCLASAYSQLRVSQDVFELITNNRIAEE